MTVSALAVAMIELSFGASLVPVVGAAALTAPGLGAADLATVALAAIAVTADPENSVTSDSRTNALTENNFAMQIHVRREPGLDKGDRSWQVKTSLLCGYLLKVARLSARTAPTVRAPDAFPAFDEKLYQQPG